MKILAAVGWLMLFGATFAQKPVVADPVEQAIHNIPHALTAAWEQADAKAMAALFTDDADLVIPSGDVLSGRAAIQSFYQGAFDRGYRGSHASSQIRKVRVAGATAVVDGTWSINGAKESTGAARPPEQGLFTAVLEKQGDSWCIVALREMVPRQ